MPKPPTASTPTEVVADPDNDRRHRRRFSRDEKLRILAEADRCKGRGEVSALLRKESLYSSHLTMWRQQLRTHGEAGLDAKQVGRPDTGVNFTCRVAALRLPIRATAEGWRATRPLVARTVAPTVRSHAT